MIQGNIKAIGLNFRVFDSSRILLLLQSITYSLSLPLCHSVMGAVNAKRSAQVSAFASHNM